MYNFSVKSRFHNYEVSFIEDSGRTLSEILKEGDYLIIDNKIIKNYPQIFEVILKNSKYIGIDASEPQKSYEGIIPVIHTLIENGFKKNHRLIAVGGGITQDVTAFISSVLYRGVSWIFFPTTLLAQGDSCIGSKTSINFGNYKNQIGGFYPPNHIYIDPGFLETLSDAEIKSGIGEMCHYYIVAGQDDFYRFKKEYYTALTDKKVLAGIIERSLAIKKGYIEIDELDQKERQVFNYGHSFGHAIESLTNYRIPHGIAVSYGMDMANFISVKLGYITADIRNEIRELLQQIWRGTYITDISIDMFRKALSKDKKNVGNELRLILNKGYGKLFKDAMQNDDRFAGWLEEYFTKELN